MEHYKVCQGFYQVIKNLRLSLNNAVVFAAAEKPGRVCKHAPGCSVRLLERYKNHARRNAIFLLEEQKGLVRWCIRIIIACPQSAENHPIALRRLRASSVKCGV
jgi:hypothetical protein